MNIQIKTKCKNCGKELEVGEINDSYPTSSDLKPGLIVNLQVEPCVCKQYDHNDYYDDDAYNDGYSNGHSDGLHEGGGY